MSDGKGRPDRLTTPMGGSERSERGGKFHLSCRRLKRVATMGSSRRIAVRGLARFRAVRIIESSIDLVGQVGLQRDDTRDERRHER